MLLTALETRVATLNDAALIAELSRRTFYDTFAEMNTKENIDKFLREQFSTRMLMAEVGAPGNIFLLSYYEGKPAGYARLRENNNPPGLTGLETLEVARLYAVREMIGNGVGKTLMEKSVEIAKQKQKELIWLGVWERNYRAIDFYTSWGFEKFAEHPFILGNDVQRDWLMKKHL